MTTRHLTKRVVAGSVLALGLPLAACSEAQQALDTADQALETASGAIDRAQACAKAIGIVTDFNPEQLNPEQIQQEAAQKAQQLQKLGNKVADASVQDALFAVADSYVALEKRQAQALDNVNDWLQQNLDKINKLKKVCT